MSRAAWRRLESIHAITYFAPECRAASKALGLRGFWMGYFAGRAAPLGAIGPDIVTAAFFNFHPAMVQRAIPDAWSFATPDAIVAARSSAAATAIRRLAPAADSLSDTLLPTLTRALDHADSTGRPLCAANLRVAATGDSVSDIWQAATTLREHRGDGHVRALTEAHIDGCEAHVLYAATEGVAPEVLRDNRGWSAEAWHEAGDRLKTRGLLDEGEQSTDAGHDLRRSIEARTDELAAGPYAALRDGEITELLEASMGIAEPIISSGEIPFPNPMGLPRE